MVFFKLFFFNCILAILMGFFFSNKIYIFFTTYPYILWFSRRGDMKYYLKYVIISTHQSIQLQNMFYQLKNILRQCQFRVNFQPLVVKIVTFYHKRFCKRSSVIEFCIQSIWKPSKPCRKLCNYIVTYWNVNYER